jgi:putative ABC transport system ATP-binding protein
MSSSETLIIRTRALTKVYKAAEPVHALRGIDLDVAPGEFVAIMGASGSGKSTLMNILGCLDQPTGGEYWLDGVPVGKMERNALADVRNQKLGFVFQGFNLLPRTSALENVELPLLYDRASRIQDPRAAAEEALRRVGLGHRLDHEPAQLSGGQQQRVAIARALVNRPALILADEPTGNLDSRTSVEVMSVFQELNDQGITILLVTHEHDIAQYARRIVEVRDGRLLRDQPIPDRHIAREDLEALPEPDPIPVAAAG